ncbi:36.4 kDa proline-rich protein [Manihot esculenta]|uniref:Uncharacterized protein n=3 Tax=Manihot esculenta TaxID=3983 RepID=A0ACB7H5U8_MANES|nr:36.4 kDa proline-rich protein [Manihot esculenta]XP_021622355.1 36.4 kDa proline-rich protein [Manihot esculenta]KAG8647390.1 hypothetical protein MANES_09G070500v8 [Manihot esculenta]KAG8647391.1 hypothetical protein MANES_09G070500v8 [Manihot esculenta]OAY41053.1 hypothetical protein MANES_09G070500v8 [Manihot esculenta]
MAKYALVSVFILFLNLATLLSSLACPYCPYPTPPSKPPKYPPKLPPKHPPIVKPPPHPKPPRPPAVPKPPHVPKPPITFPPPKPPVTPSPPHYPKPPVTPSPPTGTPCPPPPPPPPVPCPPPPSKPETCPIDTLKLGACVDILGGLVHIVIGSSAKDACCPVLQGLADLDAALCLCTTIKAKLLNINIIIPIALEVLVDCGKTPPLGFKCPA